MEGVVGKVREMRGGKVEEMKGGCGSEGKRV